MPNIIPGRSKETNDVIDFLKARDVGIFVSKPELSEILRMDCDSPRGSACVRSAVRYVENHYGHCWGIVRGKGIQRLNDTETLTKAKGQIKKSYRGLHRAGKINDKVNVDRLSPDEKVEFERVRTLVSIREMFSSRNSHKIERVTKISNGSLPDMRDVLKAFM